MQPTGLSWRFWLFLALVGMGLGVQWWAANQWVGNFDSDEAIYALMAEHMLAGEPAPVYMYGNSYLGAAEAWLAAAIFDSPLQFSSPVLALRFGNVLLFGLFLILHGWLTYKLWGSGVALLSTLLAAVPGALILWWTYRPIGAFGLLLVCGTAALLLSELRVQDPLIHHARLLLLGAVLGLGLWSHQLMAVYAAVVFLLWLLRTPEWRIIYMRMAAGLWPLVGVGLLGLGVMAFFTAACLPQAAYAQWSTSAKILLLAIGGWAAVGFGWVSQRSMPLLWQSITLGTGFAVGNFPQWRAFLIGTGTAASALTPSCPTEMGERARLLTAEIIPHVWGGSWLVRHNHAPVPWPEWLIAGIALPMMLVAVLYFLWHWRYIWAAVITLRPLSADDVKIFLPVLLVALPLGLALIGGNTINILATRYLVTMWQGGTILIAWSLVRLARTFPRVTAVVVVLIVLQQFAGYHALANRWAGQRLYEPTAVAELQTYLVAQEVRGGYADYWNAYTLSFLWDEQIILTPLTGIDRYPSYTAEISTLPTQAYIFPAGLLPAGGGDVAALRQAILLTEFQGGGVLPAGLNALDEPGTAVHSRQQVAHWDVWLVGE